MSVTSVMSITSVMSVISVMSVKSVIETPQQKTPSPQLTPYGSYLLIFGLGVIFTKPSGRGGWGCCVIFAEVPVYQ